MTTDFYIILIVEVDISEPLQYAKSCFLAVNEMQK